MIKYHILSLLFFYNKKSILIFYQSNFRDNIKTYPLLATWLKRVKMPLLILQPSSFHQCQELRNIWKFQRVTGNQFHLLSINHVEIVRWMLRSFVNSNCSTSRKNPTSSN